MVFAVFSVGATTIETQLPLLYEETKYSTSPGGFKFSSNSFQFSSNSSYFSGSFKLTVGAKTSIYYVSLFYFDKSNVEKLYKEVNTRTALANTSSYDYTYTYKIPLSSLQDNAKFRVNINCKQFYYQFNYSFTLNNPSRKHLLTNSSANKVYLKTIITETYARNFYIAIQNSGFLKNIKDIYYYDKFTVGGRSIVNSYESISKAYLYIYDPLNCFDDIGIILDSSNLNKKYIELAFLISSKTFTFYFYNTYFVNRITNEMFLTKKDNYIETDGELFMPLKYYEEYKKLKLGMQFNFIYNRISYTFYFEFDVNFLENYLKDEVIIDKDLKIINEDDFLKEVNI